MMRRPVFGALFALSLCAHGEEPKKPTSIEADPLTLTAPERQRLGIVVAAADQQALRQAVKAPGEVKADQYRTSLVVARVQGQVTARHAKLGDTVKKGAPLVTLASTGMADAQGELVLAAQEWRRVKLLGPDIISQRRYDEAKVNLARAQAKVEAFGMSEADARALSAPEASDRANGRFTLYAAAAGSVQSDDFVLGEIVEAGRVLFRLVDESELWVEAALPSDQAQQVVAGTPVEIVPHGGGASLSGTVLRAAPTVDAATRTRSVRIAVVNTQHRLHVGDFVEVGMALGGTAAQLAVPERAVLLMNRQAGVFVLAGDTFVFRPLELGLAQNGQRPVLAGLQAGESVVVEGAFALKARALKATLSDPD